MDLQLAQLKRLKPKYLLLISGLPLLAWGLVRFNLWFVMAGTVLLAIGCWLARRKDRVSDIAADVPTVVSPATQPTPAAKVNETVHRLRSTYAAAGTAKSEAVVEELIRQGRYALLLRSEVLGNLSDKQRQMVAEHSSR